MLKCKISAIRLVETAYFSGIFNWHSANVNGMWNARKLDGIYTIFEFILILTCICRCKLNQHLIVLNLDSTSINKVLVTEFYYCESFTGLTFKVNESRYKHGVIIVIYLRADTSYTIYLKLLSRFLSSQITST